MPAYRSDRANVPVLVVTGGPLDGTVYPVPGQGEIVVGSSMDAGVQIMLGNVEPFHARIVGGHAGLSIEDAGSATGTFVNGERVEGAHPLQEGDRICLGPSGAKGSAKLPCGWPRPPPRPRRRHPSWPSPWRSPSRPRSGGQQVMFLKGAGLAPEREHSEETARAIDGETRVIIDGMYDRVRSLMTARKSVLVTAAAELKHKETIEGERLRQLLAGEPVEVTR